MKFCRFLLLNSSVSTSASPLSGLLEDEEIREISGVPWGQWSRASPSWPRANTRLVAPVDPSKVVWAGRNHAAPAAELGNVVPKEPLLFLKPPSAIIGSDEPIVLPSYYRRVEYEGELAVVVGRRCAQLGDTDDPLPYLFGYTCLNDVTARDLPKSEVPFTRAKGFDTFCPVGPHIETHLDPSGVLVETHVNGARRQSGSTSLIIYPVAFLVRYISRIITLFPVHVLPTISPSADRPHIPPH